MEDQEVKLVLGRAQGLVEGRAARVNVGVLSLGRHEGLGIDGVLGGETEGIQFEAGAHEARAERLEVPGRDAALGAKGEEAAERDGVLGLGEKKSAAAPRLATAGRTTTLGHRVHSCGNQVGI